MYVSVWSRGYDFVDRKERAGAGIGVGKSGREIVGERSGTVGNILIRNQCLGDGIGGTFHLEHCLSSYMYLQYIFKK